MKSVRLLAPLLVGSLTLAGCGDGSVKSPTFTSQLVGLVLSTNANTDTTSVGRYFLPLGGGALLNVTATCTTPPGSATDAVPCDRADVGFAVEPVGTVSAAGDATISNRIITATDIGTFRVIASADGVSSQPLNFRVGGATVRRVAIRCDAAQVAVGEANRCSATGTFTDGNPRPISVSWSISNPGSATFTTPGQTTRVTPAMGTQGQSITVTGTCTGSDCSNGNGGTVTDELGRPLTGSATFTVGTEMLVSLDYILPANPFVQPGLNVQFQAYGTFSDGAVDQRDRLIANDQVDWSSNDSAVATIISSGAEAGLATARPADIDGSTPGDGSATITATLQADVVTGQPVGDPSRTASTALTVTNSTCTSPLLASQGAVPDKDISGLCILCDVTNLGGAVDPDDSTFATISTPVGLLGGSASLIVDAAAPTIIPTGSRVGFIVAQPSGLLSLGVLNSLAISTRLGGQETGDVAVREPTSILTALLDVRLLGLNVLGQELSVVSFVTSEPADGVALTFNSGVAAVLPTVNVFQACSSVQVPAP